jgi:hypothetical protein
MANLGAATNLVGGTMTLTLPAGTRYWYIQAQDLGSFKITFSGTEFGPVVLNAAAAQGEAGDWIDSVGFPFFGASVTITNAITATAQFGSGATQREPKNFVDHL